ncbi:MAG TPA: hypothetical protein VLJ61_16195 [Pyrinomonadaceae bacterium]|nr:hypothetical protein [Pyrinomonadaceae bacterium]
MRRLTLALAALVICAASASAQTADEIVAKYIKTIGGMDRIEAVKSLRRTGTFNGGGGFEAVVVEENKRPGSVRQDFTIQGMTGVTAYDGTTGWKIEPWNGKKDAEPLGEEEMREIVEDSDLDGPLVNYGQKGVAVEYVGKDEFEGSDVYKLKVTRPNGDVFIYYMDADYYVPIKIDSKRTIRGEEQESETLLGDYKQVNGLYLPFSVESGLKGSQNKSKVTYEKIEANVAIDDRRFRAPAAKSQAESAPDASTTTPKQPDAGKPSTQKPGESQPDSGKPPARLEEKKN